MRKILLFIAFIQTILAFTQDNKILDRSFERLRIESPNEASFNKYIDHPVDLYNGVPDVSIPVYTLSEGQISIPITLRYNTSGIKHDEEASWVGLGWNLNVGGVITRSVIGGLDKLTLGRGDNEDYFQKVMNILDIDKYKFDEHLKPMPQAEILRKSFDWYLTEPKTRKSDEGRFSPDIFYYSYPGGSGKFILDFLKKDIVILNKKDNTIIEPILESLDVQRTPSGSLFYDYRKLNGFNIITEEGVVHVFEIKGQMRSGYPGVDTVSGETFLLTKSTYPNGQTVKYRYETNNFIKYLPNESLKAHIPGTLFKIDDDRIANTFGIYYRRTEANHFLNEFSFRPRILKSVPYSSGQEFYLSEIETENNLLRFNKSPRNDVPAGKKLDDIEVIAKQDIKNNVKKIKFQYSYFTSTYKTESGWSDGNTNLREWTSEHFSNRLKLTAIETSDNLISIDKYKFHYNQTRLPRKDSYAADYWGYFNGRVGNTTFIPDNNHLFTYDPFGYLNEKLRIVKKRLYSEGKSLANRSFDFESAKAGILEGIEYPTGGFLEFTYEPQTFYYDYLIPNMSQVKIGLPSNIITISLYDDNSFFTPSDLYPSNKNARFILEKETNLEFILSLRRGSQEWKDMADIKFYLDMGGSKKDFSEEVKQWCYSQHIRETNNGEPVVKEKDFRIVVTLPKTSGYLVVDLPDSFGDQTKYPYDQGSRISLDVAYPKPVIANPCESEGGGIRIKEILSYQDISKKEKFLHTAYSYNNEHDSLSSGVLHVFPKFYNQYNNVHDILGLKILTPEDANNNQNPFCVMSYLYAFGAVRSDKIEICKDIVDTNPYQNCSNVSYSCVTKESIDKEGKKLKTIYTFHNQKPIRMDLAPQLNDPLNGTQESISYFRDDTIVRKDLFKYSKHITRYNAGLSIYDPINYMKDVLDETTGLLYMELAPIEMKLADFCGRKTDERIHDQAYEDMVMAYDRLRMIQYPINTYNVLLSEKETHQDGVITKESYTYNINTSQLLSKTIYKGKDNLKYNYIYPNDMNCGVYESMTKRNIVGKMIEEKIFRNDRYIGGRLNEYGIFNQNKIYLYKLYLSESNDSSKDVETFDCNGVKANIYPFPSLVYKNYDSYGNPINIEETATDIFYLWSYGGQYPIAEIKSNGYTDTEIENAVKKVFSVGSIDNLSKTDKPDEAKLRDGSLQKELSKAQVTTYTYKPLAGMLSVTDARGTTVYYEYDNFGRLIRTKDVNGKTVQTYDYHFQNQPKHSK